MYLFLRKGRFAWKRCVPGRWKVKDSLGKMRVPNRIENADLLGKRCVSSH